MSWIPWTLTGVAAFAFGTGPLHAAADFAPPAEGPVPFRRDRLPIDEDAITGLSRHLEVLAKSVPTDTAQNRRAAAQMLALALALDPGNARARQLVTQFSDGSHHPEAVGDQLEKSRARIWQSITWLESPDAGSNGRALANCLKDVMVVADPNHPKSQANKTDGEKGAWKDWVREAGAFETAREVAVAPTPEEPAENPAPPPEQATTKPLLEKASVTVMLWKNTGTQDHPKWALAPTSLGMHVETKNSDNDHPVERFKVAIGAGDQWHPFDSTNRTIEQLLAKQHKELPKLCVVITGKEFGESIASGRKQSISAASAVLASAAVTGNEPDAIIIGQIDSSGAYKISSGFWKQIRALGKGTGKKLLIPTDAAPQMAALLAMENPGFFMEYEVLTASDFGQLLALSSKTAPETVAPSFAKFKEIRDRSAGKDLRQYIANSFIRQRLAEVVQLSPNHLSAKLLLLQAEGKRPTLIPRKVLAAELKSAIEPMAWVSSKVEEDLNSAQIAQLGTTYDTCRTAVDALDRYAEKSDRELVEQTRELVNEIRSTERTSRSRGEYHVVRESIKSARRILATHAKELNDLLTTEIGDSPAS